MGHKFFAVAAALALAASAQPTAALVCGTNSEVPGVIEQTIAGNPVGGDFDLVILGVVAGIGPTDRDGYRRVDMEVGVVLRGSAPRQYEFIYPASADEGRRMFVNGATYLVAVETDGWRGHPTASECSATHRVTHPGDIARYVSMARDPVVYASLIPRAEEQSPVVPAGAALLSGLLLTVLLVAWRRQSRTVDS